MGSSIVVESSCIKCLSMMNYAKFLFSFICDTTNMITMILSFLPSHMIYTDDIGLLTKMVLHTFGFFSSSDILHNWDPLSSASGVCG